MNEIEVGTLPNNVTAFLALRKSKKGLNLNDEVERMALEMYGEDEFRKYLGAITKDMAIEGSIKADHIMAAHCLREHALNGGASPLITANTKLEDIGWSLNVYLRRYGQSRTERREAVARISGPSSE